MHPTKICPTRIAALASAIAVRVEADPVVGLAQQQLTRMRFGRELGYQTTPKFARP